MKYPMSRREMLKGAGLATASILAAPMINRGRFRLFAGSVAEYSSKAVDLIGRTTVIDMLNVLTPDLNSSSVPLTKEVTAFARRSISRASTTRSECLI
jgi:phage tail tape-measure protein